MERKAADPWWIDPSPKGKPLALARGSFSGSFLGQSNPRHRSSTLGRRKSRIKRTAPFLHFATLPPPRARRPGGLALVSRSGFQPLRVFRAAEREAVAARTHHSP